MPAKAGTPARVPGRGRAISEQRRSNAAGLHVKRRKNRAGHKHRAIAAELREG